jgi:hypothetical protein
MHFDPLRNEPIASQDLIPGHTASLFQNSADERMEKVPSIVQLSIVVA